LLADLHEDGYFRREERYLKISSHMAKGRSSMGKLIWVLSLEVRKENHPLRKKPRRFD